MPLAAPPGCSPQTGTSAHLVQFYSEEVHLYSVLSAFFAPFLADGDSPLAAAVLARPGTTQYLGSCLLAKQYVRDGPPEDGERRLNDGGAGCAISSGATYRRGPRRVLLVDAEEVVARLVPEKQLNTQEFDGLVDAILSHLHPRGSANPVQIQEERQRTISVYGELVDILCARGEHRLALELETLWNRALSCHEISLLCGYKMDSFRDSLVEDVFGQICSSHGTVEPTELYSSLPTAKQKLAMVAVLQQKATALLAARQMHGISEGAERRMRYREQFVDVLCHELRNPLSGLIGNVELLQMGLDVRRQIIRPPHGGRDSPGDMALLGQQLTDDIDSVDAIAECAAHLRAVSDSVLSLSKLEAGKVKLEKTPFDLKATIATATKMFRASAQKKGIALVADVPAEDLRVLGDSGRIAQVLVNLISNALKFTNSGSIIVELCYLGPARLGDCVSVFKVAVRDTGCGLSQDDISVLFQRFGQAVSTSSTKHGGSGLGLYISKYLVELMGGLLSVESKRGHGSTFSFTFHAELCAVAEPRSQQPSDKGGLHDYIATAPVSLLTTSIIHPPATDRGYRRNRWDCPSPSSFSALSISPLGTNGITSGGQSHLNIQHVLLVDDNPIIVRTLTRIFERSSNSVISISSASNGYEAIGKLIASSTSSFPIDMILMDLDMPFLNGINTTREIRRLGEPAREECRTVAKLREAERLAATLIIGLTGDPRESRFAEARDSGMNECIGKPVVKRTLFELIHRLALKGANKGHVIS